VIVLRLPDAEGWVEVATMSHRHPDEPHQRPTSFFNLPIDPQKGEGTISVGKPRIIHFTMLKPTTTGVPFIMDAFNLAALLREIGGQQYCGY